MPPSIRIGGVFQPLMDTRCNLYSARRIFIPGL
jgi:hypothetical protein